MLHGTCGLGGGAGGARGGHAAELMPLSNATGEHAGHSPSMYWPQSRRSFASEGIKSSAKLQCSRASMQRLRQACSGSPNAQPVMPSAQIKRMSAFVHEPPNSQRGMPLIWEPASSSLLSRASPTSVVGAVTSEQWSSEVGRWQPQRSGSVVFAIKSASTLDAIHSRGDLGAPSDKTVLCGTMILPC